MKKNYLIILLISVLMLCSSCSELPSSEEKEITEANSAVELDADSIGGSDVEAEIDIPTMYTGELKDELPDGKGVFKWDEYTEYDGEWRKGKAKGEGTYKSKTKTLKGTFSNNKLINGKLTLKLDTADVVFNVADKKISYDKVTVKFNNGDVYKGEWENGLNGTGTLTFANGDIYKGEFVKAKRKGQGVYTWSDGQSYDGTWKNDKMHGKGVYYFNAEKTKSLTGTFAKNTPKGTMKYLWKNHSYTTEWTDGKCTSISY